VRRARPTENCQEPARITPAIADANGYSSACQEPASGPPIRPDREEQVIARPFDPRPFIARAGWTFARSVADWEGWQHWYIVQAKYADDPEFQRFADLIAAEGYHARFEGIKYRYLRVDEFLYWTSRSLWTPGQNINRRPAADVEGQPEHEQSTLPGLTLEGR
jgi:hypothetical protein